MAGSRSRKPVVPMMFPSQLARNGPGVSPQPGERPEESDGIEISVSRESDSGGARLFVFRQPTVVIGRSSACDLRLDDPERLASSRHAEVVLSDGRVRLSDLGSRNGTFLNGERLEPRRSFEVAPADEVAISGTRLQLRALAAAARTTDERTILAPGGLNPFTENARLLVEALERVADTFEQTAPEGRAAALEQALREALGDRSAEVYDQIGQLLSRSDD